MLFFLVVMGCYRPCIVKSAHYSSCLARIMQGMTSISAFVLLCIPTCLRNNGVTAVTVGVVREDVQGFWIILGLVPSYDSGSLKSPSLIVGNKAVKGFVMLFPYGLV